MDARSYKIRSVIRTLWTRERQEFAKKIYETIMNAIAELSLDIYACVKEVTDKSDVTDLIMCTLNTVSETAKFIENSKYDVLRIVLKKALETEA